MKDLSLAQKYYLGAINEKGDAPLFTTEDVTASLLTAGLIELVAQGLVAQDEKKCFSIAEPWDESLPHLEPLYLAITTFKKTYNAKDVLGYYYLQLTDERTRVLFTSVGLSLVDAGCADELREQGRRKNITKYAPKPEAVAEMVAGIREEVLGDEQISDETAQLLFLLRSSGSLNKHFSKEERPKLKARLKEVRKSEATAQVEGILATMGSLMLMVIMGVIFLVLFIAFLTQVV